MMKDKLLSAKLKKRKKKWTNYFNVTISHFLTINSNQETFTIIFLFRTEEQESALLDHSIHTF